jgi:hypothetical protein
MREWVVVTDLRSRPQRTPGASRQKAARPNHPAAAVALAAFGAALTGLAVLTAVVLVAWITDTRGTASAGAAIRFAADAWLVAQGGRLTVSGASVDAVPLGLSVLPVILLYRAGGALVAEQGRKGLRSAARLAAGLAALYGLIAALVAVVARTGAAHVGPLSAAVGAAVIATAAGGAGVLGASGLIRALLKLLPSAAPPVVRGAAVATVTLLGAGSALAAAALAVHLPRAMDLTRALDPGLVGGVLLFVVSLLLLPNAAIWGAAYVAGPGFAIGAGTSVSPFGATLGPVPALPILAGLPDSAPPDAMRLVLIAPLLAGVLAGLAVARAVPATSPKLADGKKPASRSRRCAGYGAAAGLIAGIASAALAVLSGGSMGGGYLAAVGPSPWRFGLAVAVETGVPAALIAALLPARSRVSTSSRE